MRCIPKGCKHAFTLFELLIALALTAVLLSVLFRFFAGSVQIDQKICEARGILYQRQYFQMRTSFLLSSVIPRSSIPPSVSSSFYTVHEKTDSLIAVFDNGIDPDPQFSGPVLGKIYLDADANLTLAIWPIEIAEKKKYRKEILLSNVQNIRFQFLAKKAPQSNDFNTIPINPTLEWRTDWPKNRWDIPSIVRMYIYQDNQEAAFAFMLPVIEPIVTYTEQNSKIVLRFTKQSQDSSNVQFSTSEPHPCKS